MNEVVVRRAGSSDARQLAGLRWESKAEGAGPDLPARERFVDRHTTWFVEALRDDWVAWVAEESGRLVGALFVRVVNKVPSPLAEDTAIGYVTNFFVTPDRRGEGIGGALLAGVQPWATSVPLDALVVWPSDNWAPEYERVGFTSGAVLQLPIRPESGR